MSEVKWTERNVSLAVASHFNTHRNVVLPNYSNGLLGYEADLVILRPSNWAEEVEVKVSVADYRHEFKSKAKKHRVLQHGHPTYHCSWSVSTEEERAAWNAVQALPTFEPSKGYRGAITSGYDWGETTSHNCKKYWFAMPEELAEKLKDEIPDYAGLIAVGYVPRANHWPFNEYYPTRIVKEAPNLRHAKKLEDKARIHILQCAYYRFWDMRRKEAS